jgi:hypothetical protein
MARKVLPFHAEDMIEDGGAFTLRTHDELRKDPVFQEDAKDAVLVGFVKVDLPGPAVVRGGARKER